MMSYPLVIPSVFPGSTGTGPTLRRYRQVLGEELGWWGVYTILSASSSNPDANRMALVAELQDDDEAVERLAGGYVYVRSSSVSALVGQQRRIVGRGYDGTLGALMLSAPFSSILPVNTTVEVSRPLPVRRHLDRKGLNDLVDEALGLTVTDARIAMIGDGTRSISLASWPFLQTYEQTRGIYDGRGGIASTDALRMSNHGYRIVRDGAVMTLATDATYASDEAFELAIEVQGDRLIFDGSDWGYVTTPGLGDHDDWQATIPESWVKAFGMVKALGHLIDLCVEDMRRVDADERLTDDQRKRRLAALERRIAGYERRLPTYEGAAARIVVGRFTQPISEATDQETSEDDPLAWTGPVVGSTMRGYGWP